MRTLSDFGRLHYEWLAAHPLLLNDPNLVHPPLEMTQDEHDSLVGSLCHTAFPQKLEKLFGHPVKIVSEPEDTIPLPSRV